jgi:hypothetical protein
MAKLADAADLKSAGRKAVGVQVPLWAPNEFLKIRLLPYLLVQGFALAGFAKISFSYM